MLSTHLLSIFPPLLFTNLKTMEQTSSQFLQWRKWSVQIFSSKPGRCLSDSLSHTPLRPKHIWGGIFMMYINICLLQSLLTLHNFALLSGRTWFIFTHHCKCCISPRFKSEQHRCLIGTGYKGAERSPWVPNTKGALYLTGNIPVWHREGAVLGCGGALTPLSQ